MRIIMRCLFLIIIILWFGLEYSSLAIDSKQTKLPLPETDNGIPLMKAMKLRHTTREFSSKELPLQMLSNLLWAANGINRPETGKRTVPSAMNYQEVDVYVILADGAYLYNANNNSLDLVLKEDIRSLAGIQDFVKIAPLNLIYVTDFSKMGKSKDDDKGILSAISAGCMVQNVYLFCASEELACVVRAYYDEKELSKKLKLKIEQKILITQTVGFGK
jgi:nitroreductase